MMLSKEDLGRLLKLQSRDLALDTLQASIDKIPKDIQAIEASLQSHRLKLTELKNAATRLQLSKKEGEISLSQKEEAVRKHNQELNQVKTNEAYKALQAEIEKAKLEASEFETQILVSMDEIDQTTRQEKAAAAALKEAEGMAQKQVQELEAEKTRLSAQAQAQGAQRDGLAQGFSPELMKVYEHLRKRRKGVALSPVKGTSCGACRMTVLPQSLVELAKGGTLVTCESCQRILYRPEGVAGPALEPKPVHAVPPPTMPDPLKYPGG